MVKALFALAKYLWWFIKPLVLHCCVANVTHMLQTSSFNQTHAGSSCFKQYFPFLLEGKNIHNIHPLPVLIIFLNPLPVLVALKILRDILSFTRSFMINTRSLVGCLENSDRKVIKTIPCYTADCFKLSCLQFSIPCPKWICPVLQRDSRFVLWNCHATDIALTNGLARMAFKVTTLVYSYKANQTQFECSLLF